jgi:hypothetical protein
MIQSENEKQRLEDEVEGSRSQQGFSDLRKWHLKNKKQLHPRRKFKNNLVKVKGKNANAEAPKINGKDMNVHGLISLHGKMEPKFIKNDKIWAQFSKTIYF